MNFDISVLLAQVLLFIVGVYCIRYGIHKFFKREAIGFIFTALDSVHIAWSIVFGGILIGILIGIPIFWLLGNISIVTILLEGAFYLGICLAQVIVCKGIVILLERRSTSIYAIDDYYHRVSEDWSNWVYYFVGYIIVMILIMVFALIFTMLAFIICLLLGVNINV